MSECVWERVGVEGVSDSIIVSYFSLKEKLKTLAQLLRRALFSDGDTVGRESGERGKETSLQRLIMDTMIRWAQQPIHSPELIQQIFALLYRQCDEINEVVSSFDCMNEGEEFVSPMQLLSQHSCLDQLTLTVAHQTVERLTQ